MLIWAPFPWTQRILGHYVWGQSGTSVKEQGSHDWHQIVGHRRPVQRPRCIGNERARTQSLFYSILFYSILFYSLLFYSILFYSILTHILQRMRSMTAKDLSLSEDFTEVLRAMV